ncbi:hypothetical protein DFQ27_009426 [Actinomortierella ambigua]|uniref:Zn(2)-C6 fungal-type domain-containing protein n=1 Tax=Actinomortierella ambigua TaxID=1343610 RepID=A0A9P6PN27_9FUNG|nr:hypothetical protein DFQ27_009426 [Actinomortierella ambigua]
MPMQVFEFQADESVSLVSPAAISRKSCDHCFLNRKTCDKVRGPEDSGAKCKRCAKDNRPCTFTPTVHLYHIADCVGRHQCRAKVLQAMGGRKKEARTKTIEIPLVCDLDSPIDLALFEALQRQPNLLAFNNRLKSLLAQDLLGISPEQDDADYAPQFHLLGEQGLPDYTAAISVDTSSLRTTKRQMDMDDATDISPLAGNLMSQPSPSQGPQKYRIMDLVAAHQQQQLHQQIQQQQQQHSQPPRAPSPHSPGHQRGRSESHGRISPRLSPSLRPNSGAGADRHPHVHHHHHHPYRQPGPPSPRHGSVPDAQFNTVAMVNNNINNGGRLSPVPSPTALSPTVDAGFHQRRHSETVAAAMMAANASEMSILQQQQLQQQLHLQQQQLHLQHQLQHQQQQQQQQQHHHQQPPMQAYGGFSHPYAKTNHAPSYPMAQYNYRSSSPLPPSPVLHSPVGQTQVSPQPPSPLDLSSTHMDMTFGSGSQVNLPSLFDSSLSMSNELPSQSAPAHRVSVSTSPNMFGTGSPSGASLGMGQLSPRVVGTGAAASSSSLSSSVNAPKVITTMNEDGQQVGFYFAVPPVTLHPTATDEELFRDFTMMDETGAAEDDDFTGEGFVWIENLFEDLPAEETAANMAAITAAAAAAGQTAALRTEAQKRLDLQQQQQQLLQQQHQPMLQQQQHQYEAGFTLPPPSYNLHDPALSNSSIPSTTATTAATSSASRMSITTSFDMSSYTFGPMSPNPIGEYQADGLAINDEQARRLSQILQG